MSQNHRRTGVFDLWPSTSLSLRQFGGNSEQFETSAGLARRGWKVAALPGGLDLLLTHPFSKRALLVAAEAEKILKRLGEGYAAVPWALERLLGIWLGGLLTE